MSGAEERNDGIEQSAQERLFDLVEAGKRLHKQVVGSESEIDPESLEIVATAVAIGRYRSRQPKSTVMELGDIPSELEQEVNEFGLDEFLAIANASYREAGAGQ